MWSVPIFRYMWSVPIFRMMASINTETVTSVKHWTDRLFSFKTTRDPSFRFKNGHFTMIGLAQEGRPLMRAYSLASANYENELEFFSIKVADGPLTSKLQLIKTGDEVLVSRKPTGTLTNDALLPGKRLWLLATGTGLAPFLSIIKDPDVYAEYEKIILVHGCRYQSELAYQQLIAEELPCNEFFGQEVREKLLYYPTVTREPFRHQGRITDLFEAGVLEQAAGIDALQVDEDRFMLCGSPSMLRDTVALLNQRGFTETRAGQSGEYVIERAFVES